MIKSLLAETGVEPSLVDEVILGTVLTAGVGMNPARQAALDAGYADVLMRGAESVLSGVRRWVTRVNWQVARQCASHHNQQSVR